MFSRVSRVDSRGSENILATLSLGSHSLLQVEFGATDRASWACGLEGIGPGRASGTYTPTHLPEARNLTA